MYISNKLIFFGFSIFIILLGIFFQADSDFFLTILPKIPTPTPFKDQVVWVVGASSGLGAGITKEMAKSGAKIIISARRKEMLENLAQQCEQDYGIKPEIQVLDITNKEAQAEAYNNIIQKHKKIDVLILNSGQSQRQVAVDAPLEDTKYLMNLNFFSYVSLTKLALPQMLEQKSGKIVVMSSLSGIMGTTVASSYSASKFALHGYFNALRTEVDSQGVKVTVVCPGPVNSEIISKTLHNKAHNINAGKEVLMPTERFSELFMKGLYYDLDEIWIAHQPFLLFTYMVQYTPAVARFLFKKVFGPARMRALISGENLFDIKVALGLK